MLEALCELPLAPVNNSLCVTSDCLVKLCNVAPLVVIDNLPILLRLLDFLGQLPALAARRVISAVLSLVKISNKLRDSLILVLRKALFSR